MRGPLPGLEVGQHRPGRDNRRSWVVQRNLCRMFVSVIDGEKIWEHVVFDLGTWDEFPGWWILMRIYETSWIKLTFWLPGLYSACLHATLWCQHYVAAWQICKLRRLSTWAIAKSDSQTIQNWVSIRAGMLSWQGLQDLESWKGFRHLLNERQTI